MRQKQYTVTLTLTQTEVDEEFGLWDIPNVQAYVKDAIESWVGGMDPDCPEFKCTIDSMKLRATGRVGKQHRLDQLAPSIVPTEGGKKK